MNLPDPIYIRTRRSTGYSARVEADYFGTHFFVASSHLSVALQSTGPVGAGVDWANADIEKAVIKLPRTAAEISLRVIGYSMEVQVN